MTGFRTFSDFVGLKNFIKQLPRSVSIGLVPTMGALHVGHISLIKRALSENAFVVVTLFVNPKQFNKSSDLINYPRVQEEDIKLLNSFDRLGLCIPEEQDVYPVDDPYQRVELGLLDQVLEGEFRPGHFDGVAHVVHNLIQLIKPKRAYFGLKDAQQLAVIKLMVRSTQLPVQVVACETVRDAGGLALSSRNSLLSKEKIIASLVIYKTLTFVKDNVRIIGAEETKKQAAALFSNSSLTLEYIGLVNRDSFQPFYDSDPHGLCCIAAYCDGVRLIDNVLF
tara:strand:- start:3637 stop:4476 length:840 start_codon:yes stop_codon:yes gene_type:complete